MPVLTGEVAQRFEREAQANYQRSLNRTILLSAVDTAIITRFSNWLDEQKARNGTDQPLSLDTRMVILRAIRAVGEGGKFTEISTICICPFKD